MKASCLKRVGAQVLGIDFGLTQSNTDQSGSMLSPWRLVALPEPATPHQTCAAAILSRWVPRLMTTGDPKEEVGLYMSEFWL